jgi:NADPH:quinone reductase-like Zn-dependent oxidoreductase
MRAAWAERYGRADEVVRVVDRDRPTPVDDQVLVKVHVASVNRADLDGLGPKPGFLRLFMGLRAPRQKTMGIDLAGVVEAVGPRVTRFKAGDRVFGDLFAGGQGAFAEYAAPPEKALAAVPDGVSLDDAATLGHSAILAMQGWRLRNGRTIQAGDKVLVDGASGNVGPFAVQMAKALGAEVTGVASGSKLDLVRSLGADHVIDYRTTDYTKAGVQYDWIVAVDSHHGSRAVRRAVRPGGVYLTMGGSSWTILESLVVGPIVGRLSGRRIGLMLHWKPMHPPDVARVLDLVESGQVRPVIDRRYPLEEVAAALNRVDDGEARGKVLLDVAARGSQPS